MAELTDSYSFACPASAPFFGYFGAASAMALANLGAAYGTAKAGAGISGMGVSRPDLVMKALIPVVMAGVVGIYGLIIAVIISTKGECETPAAAASRAPRRSTRRARPGLPSRCGSAQLAVGGRGARLSRRAGRRACRVPCQAPGRIQFVLRRPPPASGQAGQARAAARRGWARRGYASWRAADAYCECKRGAASSEQGLRAHELEQAG